MGVPSFGLERDSFLWHCHFFSFSKAFILCFFVVVAKNHENFWRNLIESPFNMKQILFGNKPTKFLTIAWKSPTQTHLKTVHLHFIFYFGMFSLFVCVSVESFISLFSFCNILVYFLYSFQFVAWFSWEDGSCQWQCNVVICFSLDRENDKRECVCW